MTGCCGGSCGCAQGPEVRPLPDVTQENLLELLKSDHPVLREATERLLLELNDPDGIISAFQSFGATADEQKS